MWSETLISKYPRTPKTLSTGPLGTMDPLLRTYGIVYIVANTTHNQKVVGSNLVSSKILDINGAKAMPGSIPTTNFGSVKKNRKKSRGCYSVNNISKT